MRSSSLRIVKHFERKHLKKIHPIHVLAEIKTKID